MTFSRTIGDRDALARRACLTKPDRAPVLPGDEISTLGRWALYGILAAIAVLVILAVSI